MLQNSIAASPVYIDCRQLGGSGIGTYIENLIRQYESLSPDFAFEYLAMQNQVDFIKSFSRAKVKIYNDPIYSVVEQFKWVPKINPFGLLHIPHYNAPVFYPGKLVVTVHDVCHLAMKQFFPGVLKRIYSGPFLKRILNKANQIITVSNFSKSEIIKYYKIPADKITVIYNGVDASFIPIPAEQSLKVVRKYNIPDSYLLFVGNIKRHKNIIGLISSFQIALQKNPDLPPLVLLGQYTDLKRDIPEIIHLVQMLLENKKIIFTGVLPTMDLPAIYSRALLFLFPSFYEGFGLSILEAMACGTPVITSNCSSIPEVVHDAAMLINPYDNEMISDAILKLAGDTGQQEMYRERGFRLAQQYSWKTSAEKHLRIFADIQKTVYRSQFFFPRRLPVLKEKANILFLDQYGDRVGGGQIILLDILEKFRSSERWNVFISVPSEGKFTEKLKQQNFSYYCTPTWKPSSLEAAFFLDIFRYVLSSIKSTFYHSQKVKEYDIDVVYCNGGRTFLNGAFLSLLFSIKVFFHLHLIMENQQKRAVTLLGRAPSVQSIIAVSSTLEKQYETETIHSKITIVANWVSPALYQIPRIKREASFSLPIRIGVVGQISQAKGQWTILESLSQSKAILPIRLSIFGDPLASEPESWNEFEANIVRLKQKGWDIINAGFKNDTVQIYDNLDLLIIPSIVPEAFGLTAIEAMVRGVIVIANRSGALPEIIQNRRNGLLYNSRNFHELIDLIVQIMDNRYKIDSLRGEGVKSVSQFYHPEKQLDKIYDIVSREILKR
ncbi:glycosyltransferase [bacterium]|nr:glycosyltransferase [bacterium]